VATPTSCRTKRRASSGRCAGNWRESNNAPPRRDNAERSSEPEKSERRAAVHCWP
jgi:hypothetical protein